MRWGGRRVSERGCMMPDAEMQRCHCNVVVGCRRTAENGVDLPKGSETLLIFHVRPSTLFTPPPYLPTLSPLSRSFFTYTPVLGRKVIVYLVNTRSFEMQMANCVKINYTPFLR